MLGVWGGGSIHPYLGGSGAVPPKNLFFWHVFASVFVVFRHMVFVDGFLILVKELGLLTNSGQWIRDFLCQGIICIVLYCKQWRHDE
jgi:hypothetical protein